MVQVTFHNIDIDIDINLLYQVSYFISSSIGQLLEEFFFFFSTEFDFANCVVSIRHGHITSITSVLDELKGVEYSETDRDKNLVTIDDSGPTCETAKIDHCEVTAENISWKEKFTKQQKALANSSAASPGSNKLTEFKVSPLCIQDPFELVHNLTQNISASALKHIIELMKTAHRICKDLNGCIDGPHNSSKFLDLLTVCRSTKKRKTSHCHSFFVDYRDISPQAFDGSCSVVSPGESSVKLATPRGIFFLIIETLEREFGLKCEMKSAKRPSISGKNSDSSQAAQPAKVSQVTQPAKVSPAIQPAKVSQVTQFLKESPMGGTGNNSDAREEDNQTRTSDEVDKSDGNLAAVCTAFENTWTHSRRERRKSLQPQRVQRNENSTESTEKDVPVEEKAEQKHPEKSKESKFQISSPCKNPMEIADVHTVASPILIFELNVDSSLQMDSNPGCTVSMERAESKDFQLFGNFFSAYKKYFMGLISK